jgi:hypothetical protein
MTEREGFDGLDLDGKKSVVVLRTANGTGILCPPNRNPWLSLERAWSFASPLQPIGSGRLLLQYGIGWSERK